MYEMLSQKALRRIDVQARLGERGLCKQMIYLHAVGGGQQAGAVQESASAEDLKESQRTTPNICIN